MYRPQVPEYQVFHCVNAPSQQRGGRTLFVNTQLVLQSANKDQTELWEKITGTYIRKMDFYDSKTVSPLIVKHPYKEYYVIRYNEPHHDSKGKLINPVDIEFSNADDGMPENFYEQLQHMLYSPEHLYAHQWQDGDVVIADNHTLLHGREEFEDCSPRHIRRVQIESSPPYINPALKAYQ
jgi:alpha-ketoglutarate-dependent taurine dioxygenase